MIVTTEAEAEHVMEQIGKDAAWSYEVNSISLLDVDHVGEKICGIPIVAKEADVIDVTRQSAVDVVLLYCPQMDNRELELLVQSFLAMGVVCHNCVEQFGFEIPAEMLGKSPGAGDDLYHDRDGLPPYDHQEIDGYRGRQRRCVDYVIVYPFCGTGN